MTHAQFCAVCESSHSLEIVTMSKEFIADILVEFSCIMLTLGYKTAYELDCIINNTPNISSCKLIFNSRGSHFQQGAGSFALILLVYYHSERIIFL